VLGQPAGDGLDPLLRAPGARVRIARDRGQAVVGLSALVPVSSATLPVLQRHAVFGSAVRAYFDRTADVTGSPAVFCHAQVAWDGAPRAQTLAALLRDSFDLLVLGGVHITCGTTDHQQAALESLGFEPLRVGVGAGPGAEPCVGYVLDLSRTGVDTWLDAVAAGRQPPRGLAPKDLERELRAMLPRWHDDEDVRRSGLWECGVLARGDADRAPAELRQWVGGVLSRLEASTTGAARLPYRALDLAYLTPRVSNEAAAERLAVSRATFYRLVKRGIRDLAAALSEEPMM
jgi:hypothetical protein